MTIVIRNFFHFHFSLVKGNQENNQFDKETRSKLLHLPTNTETGMEISNSGSHFECGACGATFLSLPTLQLHKKEQHKNGFFCISCEKYFNKIHLLKNHSRTHLSRKCLTCDFVCNSALQLKQHQKLHKLNQCDNCKKSFHTANILAKHKERGSCVIRCSLCPKSFSQHGHRKTHERVIHLGQRSTDFDCDICKKPHDTNQLLQIHMTSHSTGAELDFPCSFCGKHFKANHLLKGHVKFSHASDHKKCQICDKTIPAAGMKVHSHSMLACNQCPFTTFTKLKLRIHKKKHISGNQNVQQKLNHCTICSKSYYTVKGLKDHIVSLHQKKLSQCKLCPEKFKTVDGLKSHMKRIHQEIKKGSELLCEPCGLNFQHKYKLTSHIKEVHVNIKNFPCSKCERKFKRNDHLQCHMRLHTGERPFKCETCDSSFKDSTSLRTHKYLHTGERPFKCGDCDKTFVQPHHLKSHKLSYHTKSEERPSFKCSSCEKAYSSSDGLKGHQETHDEKVKCLECEKEFTRKGLLNLHMRRHRNVMYYNCAQCDKSFKFRWNYRRHMDKH